MKISTFAKPVIPKSDGGDSGMTNFDMDFQNLWAKLSMKGPSEIDLGKSSKILLGGEGKDDINNLGVEGHLNDGMMKTKSKDLDMKIGAINASLKDFQIPGSTIDTTGGIHINNVHDVHLDFDKMKPTRLNGEISSAPAKGIEVKMPAKKPKW